MEHLLTACSCGLDPATETMAVQAGLAAVLSTPFLFRDWIANTVRRLRGRSRPAVVSAGTLEDEPPSN